MRSSATPLTIGGNPPAPHGGAAVDREFDGFAITEVHQRVAGDAAFLLGAAGQMMHAAERQHLRAIFAGRDVADRLALGAHCRGLGAEMAIGIDLHLDAAIRENAFVTTVTMSTPSICEETMKGAGLVIGIGGAGADCGHEHVGLTDEFAVPIAATGLKRHQPPAMRYRSLQHDMRIDAYQFAIVIGVTIARARRARFDVAHHRTGIAADLVATFGHSIYRHEQACSPEAPITAAFGA